jgi:hypothetical protein
MCEIYARHGANHVPRAGLYPRWSTMGMSFAGNKLPAGLAVPPNVGEAESGGGGGGFLRDCGACWVGWSMIFQVWGRQCMPDMVSTIIRVDCLGRRTRDSLMPQRTPECSATTCDTHTPQGSLAGQLWLYCECTAANPSITVAAQAHQHGSHSAG